MTDRRRFYLCIAAIAASLAIYSAIVIRNFSGPIGDHVESFLYEYLSYYTSKNLTFTPLPHLGLENDQAFYPFGTNVSLQSFCVERDLLFSLLTGAFGRGPWLQLYYLAGMVIAAYGAFFLLRKEHGDVRAALVAIASTCLNFYGAQKYPYHFNMACVHWTTLSIVCDFVIVERLVTQKRVSLRLILLRTLLLVLSFGLELGHVLGYGLTSLLATCVFTLVLLVVRAWRGAPSELARFGNGAREELRNHRRTIAALLAGIVTFALLYGSIVAQLVMGTKRYDFKDVMLGVWWSHPIRLLIPYTPWVHPSQQPRFLRIFLDQAEEGIGSGGAGIALLALAILGIVQSKRRLRLLPLFVIFVMFVVSRPGFDLVRWMPWFAFTRVMSRVTVIYSTVLALLAIDVSFDELPRKLAAGLGAFFVAFFGIELYTFATIKLAQPAFAFDDRFVGHMKTIEQLPGEAVLDFPFCILGGNGDLHYLCPYSKKLRSTYSLQRFHHKKVIGQYLGRIHPSQTQPFADMGWPKIWDPDDPDPLLADHQVRCLNHHEWDFFDEFFTKNDFAGVQLALDRLPPGCAEEFYTRYGQPIGTVEIPNAGRLSFIPKPAELRAKVDKEAGKRARLVVVLEEPVQVVQRRLAVQLDVSGVSGWEWLGDKKAPTHQWRWALMPETKIGFDLEILSAVFVDVKFMAPFDGQTVEVVFDGRPLETWNDIPMDRWIEKSLEVNGNAGRHTLELRYAKGNGPAPNGVPFATVDPRAMTIKLASLTLRSEPLKK